MRSWLEYFGGVTDAPPKGLRFDLGSRWWGVYWAVLVLLLYIFGAQTSRFLYVDF